MCVRRIWAWLTTRSVSLDPHQLQFMQAHQPLKLLGEQDVTSWRVCRSRCKRLPHPDPGECRTSVWM